MYTYEIYALEAPSFAYPFTLRFVKCNHHRLADISSQTTPGSITTRTPNLGQAREHNFKDMLQPFNEFSRRNVVINIRWCYLPGTPPTAVSPSSKTLSTTIAKFLDDQNILSGHGGITLGSHLRVGTWRSNNNCGHRMVGSERQHGAWRYTWEAQSHTPTLRLLLFPLSKSPNLSLQCHNLTVRLHSLRSFLIVTSSALSLRVLLPTVLVDTDSPPTFRALSDHIEVKLLLLVPVDHPVLSALNPPQTSPQQDSQPLLMESDVKILSSKGEVDFFCRRCGFQLTKNPLRNFVEMPSANWREVADNWFGACCCSFGGISEKLVMRYPEYCGSIVDNPGDDVSKGKANFVLNKERTSTHSDAGEVTRAFDEDLRISLPENEKLSVNFRYDAAKNEPDCDSSHSCPDLNNLEDVAKTPSCCAHMTSVLGDEEGEHHLCGTARNGGMPTETMEILGNEKSPLNGFLEVTRAFDEDLRISHPENEKLSVNFRYDAAKNEPDRDSSHSCPDSNNTEDVAKTPSCCAHMTSVLGDEDGEHHLCGSARNGGMLTETMEILGNQKSLLNGFLEDVFMARSSNLSKDIVWHEYTCPECISLVGSYPCCEGDSTPVDGGVRLFKCYISTCAPVGGSGDVFFRLAKNN
ncbi:Ubiquitin-conjugating enzyme E2-binding protein [Sesbania bispinosa]|nr:Ubiquitin-conjugating enzyme E2-binding protein [Sesbania bispinosa]